MTPNYLEMFPVQGRVFAVSTGKWRAHVTTDPQPFQGNDRLLFDIDLNPIERDTVTRHLRLWVSKAGLHTQAAAYVSRLFGCVETCLARSNEISAEFECFGN